MSIPLASTVILLRDGARAGRGLETFLLRRRAGGAFGGAHVFPGGRVDAADGDAAWSSCVAGEETLTARLSGFMSGREALAHAVAGVREVFEEAGVLLGAPVPGAAALDAERRALLDGHHDFLEWCRTHGVRLALEAFRPWAHWITPETEARRFDTWFFVAVVPPGREASVVEGEALDGGWMGVAEALAAQRENLIVLAPPTLRTLEELSAHCDAAAVVAASAGRRLIAVTPRRLAGIDPPTLVLPTDPEFGNDEELGVNGPPRFVMRDGRWVSSGQ